MTQTELLRFATNLLERLGIPYAIVGSFATAVWGDARMTRDIDIVVQLADGRIDNLCDAFPADDFYVSRQALVKLLQSEGSLTSFTFDQATRLIL